MIPDGVTNRRLLRVDRGPALLELAFLGAASLCDPIGILKAEAVSVKVVAA
jgi:hypothetical protein